MITSAHPTIEFDATAVDVTCDNGMLRVKLADGREIAAPLEYFPRLRDASQQQLDAWQLIGHGYGIQWEALDEHLSVKGLMRLN
jgi:hypothetical protein